jgi:hypothetical protein
MSLSTKPELPGHWRHAKLKSKLEERRAEAEAARIKDEARQVLVREKEAFLVLKQKKDAHNAKFRAKNEISQQQIKLSRIMGASVRQFETQSMLHDMKSSLRHTTNSVSEHFRKVEQLETSLTRLQDQNRREPKYYDAESKIKDILERVRKPVLTEEGVLPRHMEVLRQRVQIGFNGDGQSGSGKRKKIPPITFVEIDAVGKIAPLYKTAKSCPICNRDIMPDLFVFHKSKCQAVKTQRILNVVDCEVPQVS